MLIPNFIGFSSLLEIVLFFLGFVENVFIFFIELIAE